MATSKTAAKKKTKTGAALLRAESPEIRKTLQELHERYGKYVVPDEELRKMMAEAMGDRTLTQELEDMREGR